MTRMLLVGRSSLRLLIALGKDRLAYLVAFSSLLPLIPSSLCLSDLDRVSIRWGRCALR